MTHLKEWRVAIYLRLSKDDPDKNDESNSITNQRTIVREFIENHDGLTFSQEDVYVDDGFTGLNFHRPGFEQMMAKVESGEINCILVKDLSRFGRDLTLVGNYIEKYFYKKGIRFIAVLDGIDTASENYENGEFRTRILSLINDNSSQMTSIRTRSALRAMAHKGIWTGNRAPYGYLRDEATRKMLVDPVSSAVVQQIFAWRMNGLSADAIAKKLNAQGVPSPLVYAIQHGDDSSRAFCRKDKPIWYAKSVLRILNNRVYVGYLEQRKVTTVNYKLKKVVHNNPEDWAVTPNDHEAVISPEDFQTVQNLMRRDSRFAVTRAGGYYPLSGMVFCGSCGQSMVVQTVPGRHGQIYHYYICSTYKASRACSSHSIAVNKLETAVYRALIACAQTYGPSESRGRDTVLADIDRMKDKLKNLFDRYATGKITPEMYRKFKPRYEAMLHDLENELDSQDTEFYSTDKLLASCDFSAPSLTRLLAAKLIDRVVVEEVGTEPSVKLYTVFGRKEGVNVGA
jgi:DNA invertase Pin-like site-specific DNA recombinase